MVIPLTVSKSNDKLKDKVEYKRNCQEEDNKAHRREKIVKTSKVLLTDHKHQKAKARHHPKSKSPNGQDIDMSRIDKKSL